jgi:hypothetical protein
MFSVTNMIENGFILLPTEAHWLGPYLHELISFPTSKHDDQIDSTSQALDWAKTRFYPLPLIEYLRRQALSSGAPLEGWMVDNWEGADSGEPLTCPKCQNPGPAQYGRNCHCNQCGHKWNPSEERKKAIPKCLTEDGDILEWDDRLELWVNTRTGVTYPPGGE